jgi:hypothetical protein
LLCNEGRLGMRRDSYFTLLFFFESCDVICHNAFIAGFISL